VTTAAPVWVQHEIELVAQRDHADPYTGVEVWADFVGPDGLALRRPAFWAGGGSWFIRFAPPTPGRWRWTTVASVDDPGLAGRTGELAASVDPNNTDPFVVHGFWRMSPGARSVVHADGTAAVLIADTPWALPWRATPDQVETYAAKRQEQGFNAALLMTVQPDMRAAGPRDRGSDEGFDVGFEDLPDGHLNDLNPDYFTRFDELIGILRAHGIVPVLQPVFFGFGWKGLDVAGPVVPPAEYARYCRYLVARYGAGPAAYLVGADGSGYEPQLPAGGAEIRRWDGYRQPIGLHYRPHTDNRAHQDADWLDFQWCQTGHTGEHAAERVADMWRNVPAKAIANGEPTYEGTRGTELAAGWWQGHEAWSNLCAGGTMGVVYGAASLWQWVLRPGEPGHPDYFLAPGCGWREALEFPGAAYLGVLGRILAGLPTTDMRPGWSDLLAVRCLVVPGMLCIVYAEHGTPFLVTLEDLPSRYRCYDPRTGAMLGSGRRTGPVPEHAAQGEPRVFVFYDGFDDLA
jgi:hypothetical protein